MTEPTSDAGEDRRVFRYFDGSAAVYADPMALNRRLIHELGGEQDAVFADSHSPVDGVAYPAVERLLAAARRAFGMAPFDPATGTGPLEKDVRRVLNEFLDFFGEPATPPASTATSPPSTAAASSPSPTPPSAASGSTSTASPGSAPTSTPAPT